MENYAERETRNNGKSVGCSDSIFSGTGPEFYRYEIYSRGIQNRSNNFTSVSRLIRFERSEEVEKKILSPKYKVFFCNYVCNDFSNLLDK